MPIEQNPQYISDLDPAWPTGADDISEGDNHLRNIKFVLQTQFPGLDNAVTATDEEMNYLDGVTSSVQDQLDAIISVTPGTVQNSMTRWNGVNWVETSSVNIDSSGVVRIPNINTSGATENVAITSDGSIVAQAIVPDVVVDPGTISDQTLRWDNVSSEWVPSSSLTVTSAGTVAAGGAFTANAGALVNAGLSVVSGATITSGNFQVSNGNTYLPTVNTAGQDQLVGVQANGLLVSRAIPNEVPNGSATHATLRWDGSNWVSSTELKVATNGVIVADLIGTGTRSVGATPQGTLVELGQEIVDGSANQTLRWDGTAWAPTSGIISTGSSVNMPNLAGTGNRSVDVNAAGDLVAGAPINASGLSIVASGLISSNGALSSSFNIASVAWSGQSNFCSITYTNSISSNALVQLTTRIDAVSGFGVGAATVSSSLTGGCDGVVENGINARRGFYIVVFG